MIGARIKRKEDRRFLTGHGRYLDDVPITGVLHAAIVRSPHAHARIERVDGAAALALPGVVAVLSLAELPECAGGVPPLVPSPRLRPYLQPVIAGERSLDPHDLAVGPHADPCPMLLIAVRRR